jgi:DNA invertase Pin-like site-specific DNA recombinase
MSDVLSDTAQALIAAGLDAHQVRAVIREQRARWGGAAVYVRAIDREERAGEIRQAVAQGVSLRGAAREAGCSDDTVRRVLARAGACWAGVG